MEIPYDMIFSEKMVLFACLQFYHERLGPGGQFWLFMQAAKARDC